MIVRLDWRCRSWRRCHISWTVAAFFAIQAVGVRRCGEFVCVASVAYGIGGLDERAQGCIKPVFCFAGVAFLF